ncbi:uncharacterized protein DUF4440 [Jatrophihabitans sp. GAS493]|uniref:nuclear transport factor 2 family protein n=1 Tax=Jatrophihabitans sp. GAS493 TaxID=1907575 RepID=UPI000BB8F663|nr:nuclear transport factor 2 family protein [Jatrophihabitans sp. GAS493]SOD72198.1 uncharacterized protein DUF4440 [Jatrophihabitans sp. GAS493]
MSAPGLPSAETDVVSAARARADALVAGDATALRRLTHERFVWTSHRGDRFNRDEYLAANIGGDLRWHRQELEHPSVQVVADTAVLRCIVRDVVAQEAAAPPADEVYRMPVTQTWVRESGKWRCLAGHAGPRISDLP